MSINISGLIANYPKNSKREDVSGQVFNYLTAIRFAGHIPRKQPSIWLCRCHCGNEVYVDLSSLKTGNTRSCGCLRKQTSLKGSRIGAAKVRLPFGHSARNDVIESYRRNAKKRGILWSLSKEMAFSLFVSPCYYCGRSRSMTIRIQGGHGFFRYNGIDRLDAGIGYKEGNVVAACKECNLAKRDNSVESFLNMVRLIAERHLERFINVRRIA